MTPEKTIAVCFRCDGTGHKPLRGAELVREAMGWPRESPDLPCLECSGVGLVVIDKAVHEARLKANSHPPQRSRYSSIINQPVIQLPKDFTP